MTISSTATPSHLLEGLNSDQRNAVISTHGPVCIVAGAGSGKTRTITHRIAYQIATGVCRADEILAVTFTDKAATELRHRLVHLGLERPVRAATFHAAAWAQLRFLLRQAGEPVPDVLTSKVGLLRRAAAKAKVDVRDLAAEIEWAKARRLTPRTYPNAAGDRNTPLPVERMAAIFAGYQEALIERALIDYDDMILRTVDRIETDERAATTVRNRYRVFTVDEFQDVNPAQYALLRAWLGDGEEICVVGDDDQTIYSFTGASHTYLTGFPRHFRGARVIKLVDNYRSTSEILAVANAVLRDGGRVGKRLRAQSGGGPEPEIRRYADDTAEVEAVVASVGKLIANGVPPREIAVCFRINSQSEPFESAFAEAGIPAMVRGSPGFFDAVEVRRAIDVLDRAASRAANSDPAIMQAPRGTAPVPAPGAAMRPAPVPADRLAERALRADMGWRPDAEPAGESARDRWHNLSALYALVSRAVEAEGRTSLADIVTGLRQRAAAGHPTADEGGAVTLTTLHRVKGLEFDAVFIVACEDGLLPISHAKTEAEIEEERRLLYVGLTRPRRHLWVSYAERRPGWSGKMVRRRPSTLLPPRLLPPAPDGKRATSTADGPHAAALRAWRRDRARADDVPAFVVFNDRTLHDLVAVSPRSLDDLLTVHGLGPAKVSRYGSDILRVLQEVSKQEVTKQEVSKQEVSMTEADI